MENILNHIVPSTDRILKYGKLNEKVIMELKMITSLYDYIEVVTNYYDDEDNPYRNSWTDIEGFGYGWAWLGYDEKDWHKMMSQIAAEEVESLTLDKTLYFVYENEKLKTYHFVCLGDWREDVVVSFSNEEIF